MSSKLTSIVARWAFARLRETSTIRGAIVLVATALYSHEPQNLETIVQVAGALVGIVGMVFPDLTSAEESPAEG